MSCSSSGAKRKGSRPGSLGWPTCRCGFRGAGRCRASMWRSPAGSSSPKPVGERGSRPRIRGNEPWRPQGGRGRISPKRSDKGAIGHRATDRVRLRGEAVQCPPIPVWGGFWKVDLSACGSIDDSSDTHAVAGTSCLAGSRGNTGRRRHETAVRPRLNITPFATRGLFRAAGTAPSGSRWAFVCRRLRITTACFRRRIL